MPTGYHIAQLVRDNACVDLHTAEVVEVSRGPAGRLHVNVDGVCVLRIQLTGRLIHDISNVVHPVKNRTPV